MSFISAHLDAILFGTGCIIAWVSYIIGKASGSAEIVEMWAKSEKYRNQISSRDLSRGKNHPASKIRLVQSE